MNPVHIFFFLLVGHFLMDYPLQGDTTAREKNPGSQSELQKHVPWYYWMVAHCFAHSGIVALVTHSAIFTALEFSSHFVLDYLKCKGKISIHHDQIGHIVMKFVYCCAFMLTSMTPGQIF